MAFAYAEQVRGSAWSARRLTSLFLAIAVNVGFLVAISAGLKFDNPFVTPEPIQVVEVVDTVKTDPIEVPKPVVETQAPPIEVPVPDFVIEMEEPPPPIHTAPVDAAPSTAPLGPIVQDEELQASRSLTPPIYPAASRKLGEEGTVMLMIYVHPDGSVGEVRVHKSSGHPRLDQAAVQAAKKGWRFRPAKQGGAAVASWGRYAVTFQLKGA